MNEDYKIISIEIADTLSETERTFLKNLFTLYDEREFTYDLNGSELTLFLNTLDFESFREKIEALKEHQPSERIAELLNKMFNEIDRIKSYGLSNGKRIYVGYDRERKVQGRKEKEETRRQYFYAHDHHFSEINHEFPKAFENQIICGDSLDILKTLPENCIDLVFTSPPYNFGLDYHQTDDAHYWETYFEKLFAIFDECIRVLKFGGRIVINIQPLFSDYIPSHHLISHHFIKRKMIWKGEILWEKNNYNCKYTAWGSWKSPSNPYLKYSWEFIEVFCKGDLKHEGDSFMADITPEEFKKWVYAKWDIQPEFNMKKYGHPAMFPEELAERIIKLFSFKQDVVLDPFNGVGTTTSVAKKLSRKFIGIDISEEYCKIAEKRLKNTVINHHLFDEHVKEN